MHRPSVRAHAAEMTRLAGVVGLLIGVLLVVGVFATDGFSSAAAGERLINDAEGSVGDVGIVRFRADLEKLKAATNEISGQLFDDYRSVYELDDVAFDRRMRERFPALATAAIDRGDEILTSIETGVSNLEAHQSDYEAAAAIPVPWLPATVLPWFTLGLGVVLIGLGAWSLRSSTAASAMVLGAVGLFVVALVLVTQLPSKTARSQDLIDSLDISRDVTERTRGQFDTAQAGGNELLPFISDLAVGVGMTPEAFVADILPARYPSIAAVLGDSTVFERIEGEVIYRETHVDDFAKVKDQPIQIVGVGMLVLGGLLAVSGALSTLALRREQPQPPSF